MQLRPPARPFSRARTLPAEHPSPSSSQKRPRLAAGPTGWTRSCRHAQRRRRPPRTCRRISSRSGPNSRSKLVRVQPFLIAMSSLTYHRAPLPLPDSLILLTPTFGAAPSSVLEVSFVFFLIFSFFPPSNEPPLPSRFLLPFAKLFAIGITSA